MNTYYYGPSEYASLNYFNTTDLKELIEDIKEETHCKIILEPGDATRYEMFWLNLGHEKVFGKTNGQTFVSMWEAFPHEPEALPDDLNPVTRNLATDLFNKICGFQSDFYTWKELS